MFIDSNIKAESRVGPHNIDIFSVVVGLLLGDGFAEKRSGSTRITIHLSSKNVSYLIWLHKFFSGRGYCSSSSLPKLQRQIGKNGKIYFSLKLQTFSFTSFNFFREIFYVEDKKIMPVCIEELLNPLALAVWLMGDGSAHNSGGCTISTNSFSFSDCLFLQAVFFRKWKINSSLHVQNIDQYRLYFGVKEIKKLQDLVGPLLVPSMRYKLHLK